MASEGGRLLHGSVRESNGMKSRQAGGDVPRGLADGRAERVMWRTRAVEDAKAPAAMAQRTKKGSKIAAERAVPRI
jgi:hypothetical protein